MAGVVARRGAGRHDVLKVTLVCLGILLFAQILIGVLGFSALERLIADMNAERAESVARRLQDNIENGLNLGKPLAQFFGLPGLMEDVLQHSKEISGITITLPEGETVSHLGAPIVEAPAFSQALLSADGAPDANARSPKPGARVQASRGQTLFATRLTDGEGRIQGVLLLRMKNDVRALERLAGESLLALLCITLLAAAALAAVFRYLPLSSSRLRFLVPLLALALAQGGYALFVVSTFRDAWLFAMRENVTVLSADLARNLDRVLGYGLDLNRLRDIEAPFSRLARISPIIATIELVDRDGKVLNRANAGGALPVEETEGANPRNFRGSQGGQRLEMPLGQAVGRPEARGALVFHLNDALIASGVRSRVLDAVTVVVISLVTAIEMLLLSSFLMRPAPPREESPVRPPPDEADAPGRLARPILFGFLLVWALPLGFLPIYARSLIVGEYGLPQNLLLALPLTLEMAFGFLATLAAGSLADRRGWQTPTRFGFLLFSLGMALCAVAESLYFLAFARAVTGFAYGLAWMGLQGFVVTRTPGEARGRGMTHLIAGIFAGHLSGAAIGAMLMEQSGPRPVFVIGAVMALLPLLGMFTLMRAEMKPPPEAARPSAWLSGVAPPRPALCLLRDRGFAWLLFSSVIPFSVVQAGLLSFALPLYLESIGVQASNTGRVLMVYGLCAVYVGPFMGRGIDRSRIAKKTWILWGSLLASASLFGFYVGEGIAGALLAVTALALASCCLNAAQSPYMLALPEAQKYGLTRATSLMRAADKFGQMAGPLVVGALFGLLSMHKSLALTGLLCLAAILPFALFAPRDKESAAPR
ncbi:MAG: MFS transporter [Zoogloeaceae bacterium]|jgi:predicted MFS family arabinose efflux permease|nr:MFS transporter [Zoogloeaceae bacterium]